MWVPATACIAVDMESLVILLCGGDKGVRSADIKRAKELWSEWKRRNA